MAKREVNDEWEGFDGQISHYDDNKEKRYQAKIWWCLGVIGLGLIVSLIIRQIKDYKITTEYLCVEAEYMDDNEEFARYSIEEGVERYYPVQSYSVKERDGKMLLYYQPGSTNVTPIASFSSWIPYYIFFGIITGISFYMIWKIYFGKKHAVEDE